MRTKTSFQLKFCLKYLLIVSCLSSIKAWHRFSNVKFHCWPLSATEYQENMIDDAECQAAVNMEWIEPPPEEIPANSTFTVSYKFEVKPDFYKWAVEQGYFDGVGPGDLVTAAAAKDWCETNICLDIGRKTQCCIYHVSMHSCTVALDRSCGPWSKTDGFNYFISPVTVGPVDQLNWTSVMSGITAPGLTDIIVLVKIANIQTALHATTMIIPKEDWCVQQEPKLHEELQAEMKRLQITDPKEEGDLRAKIFSQYIANCLNVSNSDMNQEIGEGGMSDLNSNQPPGNTGMSDTSESSHEGFGEFLKESGIDLPEDLMTNGVDTREKQQHIFTAVGEFIVKKAGGVKRLKIGDIEKLGFYAVFIIRPGDFKRLSDDVFKYILGLIYEDFDQYMKDQSSGAWNPSSVYSEMLHDFHMARIKAICSRTFQLYKNSRDINSEKGWNNTKYLLFCAPPKVCKSINNSLIQSDVQLIVKQPWTCRNKVNAAKEDFNLESLKDLVEKTRKLFPSNLPCGRILGVKLVQGRTPYEIKDPHDLTKLGAFTACLPQNVLKKQLDTFGCNYTAKAMEAGLLDQKLTNFAAKRCAPNPKDITDITCENLKTRYSSFLQTMKRRFFKDLPLGVLCNETCMEIFKEQLPEDMMQYTVKKCFKDTNITAEQVTELGGLVMNLPMDKFKDISAEDLEKNIEKIKKDLKGSTKKKRQKGTVRNLAKKLVESGKVSELVDSKEIMKEVSLKDLKKSLAESDDVIQDLGISSTNESLGMTDSQKKWVMKEVMKKKKPEDFQMEDLKRMKSLVTGLLSSHIKKMAEAHSTEAGGMNLAAELCSYSDWPRKSLEAVNKYLIQGSLAVRNPTNPMSALTEIDVQNLGCHCLLNFNAAKYEDIDSDVCSALCTKIGYCDSFRCLNPIRKKNVLQACLKCKGLGKEPITEADFDELGPNLISQMSKSQLDLISAEVLHSGIELFKSMCMDQTLRAAVSGALQKVIGSKGSDYSSETLYMLGSAIKLLPRDLQKELDMNVIAEMQTTLIDELAPTSEESIKLKECCEKWLNETDLAHLKEQNFNLILTVKEAVVFEAKSAGTRRRRRAGELFTWTCRLIRPLPILFVTASEEEIDIMSEKDFLDCLSIIGGLQHLRGWQKESLLKKAKKALSEPDVCAMDVNDILDLGVIALAFTVDEISCLPLNESRLITALGSLKGWSVPQLRALAKRYVSANYVTRLTNMTASDISLLGPIMCGFTPAWIVTIPPSEIGQSGEDFESLKPCGIDVLTAFAQLAVQEDSFGPVKSWDAADVTQLKYIVAGLSGGEIQKLSEAAIEGLDESAIPVIPADVLKEMSTDQLKAFSDDQIHSVTKAQKEKMTVDQRVILGDFSSNFTLGYAAGHDSSGSLLVMTYRSLFTLVVLTAIVL